MIIGIFPSPRNIFLILYHLYSLFPLSFIILILYYPQIHPRPHFHLYHLNHPYPYHPYDSLHAHHPRHQRKSNPAPFSPGVFKRTRAPNNALPTKQKFQAGTIPWTNVFFANMPKNCVKFFEINIKNIYV